MPACGTFVRVWMASLAVAVSLHAEEPLVLDREECAEPHSDSLRPCSYFVKCDGEKQRDSEPRECTERTTSRVCCRHWSNGHVECDPSVVLRVEMIAPPPLVAGCVTEVEASAGPFPDPGGALYESVDGTIRLREKAQPPVVLQ
jgi:hypothetical protein